MAMEGWLRRWRSVVVGGAVGLVAFALAVAVTMATGHLTDEERGAAGLAGPQSGVQVGLPVTPGNGWVMLPAGAFRPRRADTTYTYGGNLVTLTAPTSNQYEAPLNLPHGATVTRIVLYGVDTDVAQDASLTVWRNAVPGGPSTQLGTVASSGSGGSFSVETTTIANAVVNSIDFGYYAVLSLPVPTGTLTTRGARVDWEYTAALPTLSKATPLP